MNYNVLKSNMLNSDVSELYWNENGYLEIHDKFIPSNYSVIYIYNSCENTLYIIESLLNQ